MERQQLATDNPPDLWVVLDEAALRRQVGGREVMRRQIEHLIELSSMPTLCMQLLPFSSGAYVAMGMSFVILAFPDPADPDVACTGYQTGVLWIEDTAEVARFNMAFRHLQAAALPVSDSAALMSSVLEEL